MKTRLHFLIALIALVGASAVSQPQPPPPATPGLPPGYPSGVPSRPLSQPETPKLTTFSLDFPGGTPQQLVTAIEKAIRKPLNVIIPDEHADFKLPALKMNKVDVEQLFKALEPTGRKSEAYLSPGQSGSYQVYITSYGFRSPSAPAGISDDSIWYFYVEKPTKPPQLVPPVRPQVCRFYPLTLYLERGLTVDDITTAIQTGWKMLGDQEAPAISFHKETKLLIAVGDPTKLETIDAVLKALSPTPEEAHLDNLKKSIEQAIPRRSTLPHAKPEEKPKPEN